MIPKNEASITKQVFPQIKYFIISALFFLDIGILFGGLNSLRKAGVYNVPEIHLTHWTSTLFGGMTLIMIGQIYFIFARLNNGPNKFSQGMIIVLILFLTGIFSSYYFIWSNPDVRPVIVYSYKIASLIFLLLVLSFFMNEEFKENLKTHPAVYLLLSAVIWFTISTVVFFGNEFIIFGSAPFLNRRFLFTYIYGFFTLTLFGSLSFILPILYKQKPRSGFTAKRDLVLFNTAAVIILVDEYIGEESPQILDFLGPVVWGLSGFIFLLYVFDIVYKAGIQFSLIGLLISIIMFGFFVFDTFMRNIFPAWVTAAHVHFMFLGTLVITIISIGTRLIIEQYNPQTNEVDAGQKFDRSSKSRAISIALVVISVGGILLAFTFESYEIAGYLGFVLFSSFLFVEYDMIKQIRSIQDSEVSPN